MTQSLPFSLDVIVPRIIEYGMSRSPREACGVIVPDLERPVDEWVIELDNRSPTPLNSYAIDTKIVRALVADLEMWSDVIIWHTHPSGAVGPSTGDMRERYDDLKYLVVSLPRGEAVMF